VGASSNAPDDDKYRQATGKPTSTETPYRMMHFAFLLSEHKPRMATIPAKTNAGASHYPETFAAERILSRTGGLGSLRLLRRK
jgi:hypothetical protein